MRELVCAKYPDAVLSHEDGFWYVISEGKRLSKHPCLNPANAWVNAAVDTGLVTWRDEIRRLYKVL